MHSGRWGITAEMDLAVELMRQGVFRAATHVTDRYPIEAIFNALRRKLGRPDRAFKVQIVFPEGGA